MATEWATAKSSERAPNWGLFSTSYISGFCQKTVLDHPGWHRDLSAVDLSSYVQGLSRKKLWWTPDTQTVQEPADGTSHLSSMQ
jgi:hypothetical protein